MIKEVAVTTFQADPASPIQGRRTTKTAVLVAVGLLVVAALGVYVGLRAPWGTKHPQTKSGVAMRANADSDLVMFDADDGTQLTLHTDGLWWESESAGGEGDPPCLREPGRNVAVEVGYLWVEGPSGGSRPQAIWVKCLWMP